MNPFIDILIPTFARVKFLEEAVCCALNQDYDNFNIIVLNQCEQQKLYINNNKVKIINLEKTIPTFSKPFNYLINSSKAKFFTLFCDDDLIMPWHIREHIKNILDNDLEVSIGQKSLFWMRQSNKVSDCFNNGNYMCENLPNIRYDESLEIGEDHVFLDNLKKHKYKMSNHNPSFVYCWENGSHHISGNPSDLGSFARDMFDRFKKGLEPTGNIEIIPQLKDDAESLVCK